MERANKNLKVNFKKKLTKNTNQEDLNPIITSIKQVNSCDVPINMDIGDNFTSC